MKIFTDPKGDFAIKIPVDWQYKNEIIKADDSTPHSFELYDNQIGCFCISCKPSNIGAFPTLIKNNKLITQEIGKTNLTFKENKHIVCTRCIHVWMAVVGKKFILATYNYELKATSKERIIKELNKIKKVLSTFIYIKEEDRDKFLVNDRYDKFMTSVVAVIDLVNRAYTNGSSVELVVLLASHIDALLRLSLILNNQIINKNCFIDKSLLFQNKSDNPVNERIIYRRAHEAKIITREMFDELNRLYDERNKVVHRYIITDIKTMDVMNTAYSYSLLNEKVGKIVNKLEERQFKLKIGIHGGKIPPGQSLDKRTLKMVINSIKDKHANTEINKHITISKIKSEK
jgi:hypothetical protein